METIEILIENLTREQAKAIIKDNKEYLFFSNGKRINLEELMNKFIVVLLPNKTISLTLKNEDFYINDIIVKELLRNTKDWQQKLKILNSRAILSLSECLEFKIKEYKSNSIIRNILSSWHEQLLNCDISKEKIFFKVYYNKQYGAGKWTRYISYYEEIKKILDYLGVKYTQENDAKRGGAYGCHFLVTI